ncbi:nitric oxide synthase, salivary gland-like [Cherax quadricarinatus]|uniref:nitric oxide synthase, salivary gland-like n=1 Tax=Cherax quadricarinatus TaxID=27406 RepID=UPI00387E452C
MECKVLKPRRLENFASKKEYYDSLQVHTKQRGECNEQVCNGSFMNIRRMLTTPRPPAEMMVQAKEFFDEYYTSLKKLESEEHVVRWKEVSASIRKRGTYRLTKEELQFGAKLAWRNAPRCIGRINWTRLELFDGRDVTTPQEMFDIICEHIKYATNNGNIRSAITVFPERRPGQRDFRVWNQQLISYAGYENPDGTITGDPAYVAFTKLCEGLGWKGAGGRFDVLPLVLSAATGDPQWFCIPDELVLQVSFQHPKYEWFKELELKWFAMPAVSSMMLDCGGIEFTAAPFNGWYMSTEIATRDLCDAQRYNVLQPVAEKMGLDTRSNVTLWRDVTTIEINQAVLFSFQEAKVTLMDHHTAAESFMQFMENEHRQRGGCPADWVWIVPPISGSLTPVFHQEMSLYYLKPAYEYQEPAWVTFARHAKGLQGIDASHSRKLFRKAALGVLFASTLYNAVLNRRVRVTILYATETGKSQLFAQSLSDIFKRNFNPKVMCMDEYKVSRAALENETLLLVVAATTGAGEPPQNGQSFVKTLYNLKEGLDNGSTNNINIDKITFHEDYNRYKNNVLDDSVGNLKGKETNDQKMSGFARLLRRLGRRQDSQQDLGSRTLVYSTSSGFKFAVFALGSSNYKDFCAFGKYVDRLLHQSGGQRLLSLACGDELDNQELAFQNWSSEAFKVSDEEFGTGGCPVVQLKINELTTDTVKMSTVSHCTSLKQGLSQLYARKVQSFTVLDSKFLHEDGDRWLQMVVVDVSNGDLQYQPGDHIGLFPANKPALVTAILARLIRYTDVDSSIQIFLQRRQGATGVCWEPHPHLPVASLRELLSRYLDITTPPTPTMLQLLAAHANNNRQASRLNQLATDQDEYRQWKSWQHPNLLEVLEEFPSVKVEAKVLVSALPLLQPRYYSISSCPDLHPGRLHLTVAGLQYRTRGGAGAVHQGVATGFLKKVQVGSNVELFHRSATNFHLPKDPKVPVMMVAAGSGIAPFRGFWQRYHYTKTQNKGVVGELVLYYGCRTQAEDLYDDEKWTMLRSGALSRIHLALSRQPTVPKMYVQDLLVMYGKEVQRHLLENGGHIYVCGGDAMAHDVHNTLVAILTHNSRLSKDQAFSFLSKLKEENRYHEDVFGIKLQK